MTNEPIQRLEIENYGCIQKATFHLTPLHALIGPNDSGKSTALRALRTLTQLAYTELGHENATLSWLDPMLDAGSGARIGVHFADGLGYVVAVKDDQITESVVLHGAEPATRTRTGISPGLLKALAERGASHHAKSVTERLDMTTLIHFVGSALRRPSPPILANDPIQLRDDTGYGLPSIYQAILSRDIDAFLALRERVKGLFPTIQTIRVPTVDKEGHVALEIQLLDGTIVPAAAMSEGLLYFLAYAALQHLEGSRLFLVEEPENGLHPARIAEITRILREIAKTGQVVIATHSPLVVNELTGDEISVVTRDVKTGTHAVLLKDVPGFDDAMKVYQPGEFWVSYADGKSEEPLLTGTPRP